MAADLKHAEAEVLDSFEISSSRADFVIRERAGSPAEVNLRGGDIANMGFALPFIVKRTGWTRDDVMAYLPVVRRLR